MTRTIPDAERGVALFDVDGTLRRGNLYREAIDVLLKAKLIPTPRLPFGPYCDTTEAKVALYKDLFAGRSAEIIDQAIPSARTAARELYPFAMTAIEACMERGIAVALVSHSPQPLVEAFAQALGVTEAHGTKLVSASGQLTGELLLTPKDVTTRELAAKYGRVVLALGDTLSDAPMLESAEYPLAVCYSSDPAANRLHTWIHEQGFNWPIMDFDYFSDSPPYALCAQNVMMPGKDGGNMLCFQEVATEEMILHKLGLAA